MTVLGGLPPPRLSARGESRCLLVGGGGLRVNRSWGGVTLREYGTQNTVVLVSRYPVVRVVGAYFCLLGCSYIMDMFLLEFVCAPETGRYTNQY